MVIYCTNIAALYFNDGVHWCYKLSITTHQIIQPLFTEQVISFSETALFKRVYGVSVYYLDTMGSHLELTE
jgi:hypothetical protein